MRKHPVWTMARANFHSWLRSPRTLLLLLLIPALCYLQVEGFKMTQSRLPYTMTWGESCFYVLSAGVNISVSSILYLITISELPQRISFQAACLIRSTRTQWIMGQILYCLMMALLLVAFVALCMPLFMLGAAPMGSGWSETQAIADGYINEGTALVPVFAREHFTPFTGYLLACIPLMLFWFTMSMVVLCCSLMDVPLLGVYLYVFLLVANIIVYLEFFPWLSLPVQYATLRVLLTSRDIPRKLITTLLLYLTINGALIGGMLRRVKRTDLCY